jgi:hypothetical protein
LQRAAAEDGEHQEDRETREAEDQADAVGDGVGEFFARGR